MDFSASRVNKYPEVVVRRLNELGYISYSVCIYYGPGTSRKEKVRFWEVTDREKGKSFLMKRIKGDDSILEERSLDSGVFSEEELKAKAETYAKVVRDNIGGYL